MSQRSERLMNHVLLLFFAFLALYPLYSLVVIALQRQGGNSSEIGLPHDFHVANFKDVWEEGRFTDAFKTSIIIAVVVVVAASLLSIMAGYAFGTMSFRGRDVLFLIFLFGLIVPLEGMIVPLYYDLRQLGLTDTYWSVILPQTAGSVAFGTFWMRTYFRSTPDSLIEAGLIDGGTRWTVLWRVLLPSAKPAIQVMAVLLFMWSFNDFLLPLVMLQGDNATTVPLAVYTFIQQRRTEVNYLAAAGVLASLPVVLLYIFTQRRFIQGMMAGAVKE